MSIKRRNNPFSCFLLPLIRIPECRQEVWGLYLKDSDTQQNIPAVIPAVQLFDAALRALLQERSMVITFESGDMIHIKLPATRRLAEFTGIPHYLILRSCAVMEEEKLLTKAERAGMVTTDAGSRMMIGMLLQRYLREAEEILGRTILAEIIRKAGCA